MPSAEACLLSVPSQAGADGLDPAAQRNSGLGVGVGVGTDPSYWSQNTVSWGCALQPILLVL